MKVSFDHSEILNYSDDVPILQRDEGAKKMIWQDVRQQYPAQWLVIEALEAQTTADNQRQLDHIAVIEMCADGQAAMQTYRRLHQQFPHREFYFVHTSREQLNIKERRWIGIRSGSDAVSLEK